MTAPDAFVGRLGKDLVPLLDNAPLELKVREDGVVAIRCDRSLIQKLCKALSEKFGFEHLSLISAVDLLDKFELVYNITSYQNACMLEVKVSVPKDDPKVPSITPIWGGANWHEREAYDMMGIVFEGHPDLRRILLPQDYLYFPLRKDFKMEEE